MKYLQYEHPEILDAEPGSPGFVIGTKWDDENTIAAIPVMGSKHKLAIIFGGQCVKECRNLSSAQNFIRSFMKKRGASRLSF